MPISQRGKLSLIERIHPDTDVAWHCQSWCAMPWTMGPLQPTYIPSTLGFFLGGGTRAQAIGFLPTPEEGHTPTEHEDTNLCTIDRTGPKRSCSQA